MLYHSSRLHIVRTDQPPGLRLIGDVAARTVPPLAQALADLLQDQHEIHLDLTRLGIMDLDGVTLLLSTARQLPQDGRLILHGLPPHLRQILHLTGWDATPGLELTDT